jgi:pimeloyl-ACP methyl ester carboxylesterase
MHVAPEIPGVELRRSASAPHLAFRVRPGAGDAVVLLHGVGSSSQTWLELVPLLDPSFALVMPDYRGHGASEDPEPPYEVADFVGDVVRLLDELGIRRAHLVGFSIGAVFAQATAAAHPDRVAALVLLNSIAGRTDEERRRSLDRLEVISATDPAVTAEQSVERWFSPDFVAAAPPAVQHEVDIVAANRPAPYAAAYRVLATTDLLDEAASIDSPVLLVTGENDRGSTPRMSRALHERITGSELVVVDGRQHYLHREVPELVADLINGFIRSHPAPPPVKN